MPVFSSIVVRVFMFVDSPILQYRCPRPPLHVQAADVCLAGMLRGAGRPHLAAGQAGRAGKELPPGRGAVAALLAVLVEGVVC